MRQQAGTGALITREQKEETHKAPAGPSAPGATQPDLGGVCSRGPGTLQDQGVVLGTINKPS